MREGVSYDPRMHGGSGYLCSNPMLAMRKMPTGHQDYTPVMHADMFAAPFVEFRELYYVP